MTVKNIVTWSLFAVLAFTLISCGGYNAKQKKEIEKLMLDHLAKKYNKEFSVTITDNLHSISLGNPFGGGIVGLKGEAHVLGEEGKTFQVQYFEQNGIIDDGYSTIFMTERAEQILSETLNAAYNEPLKYEIATFGKPFGLLPSNEFTLESELSEYTESFNIEVYVKKILHPDEYKEASDKIDLIQKELIHRGMNNFFITAVYLNDYDFANIDHILAVLNNYYGNAFEIDDLFTYCRLKDDCKITAAIADNGELQNNRESIEEGFAQHREPDAYKLKKLPYIMQEIETRVLFGGDMRIDSAVKHGYTILEDATRKESLHSYGKSKIYNGFQAVDGVKKHRLYLTDLEGNLLFDQILEPFPLEFVDLRAIGVKNEKAYSYTTIAVVADYRDEHNNVVTKSSVYLVSNRSVEYNHALNEELNRLGIASLKDIFTFVKENKDDYREWMRFYKKSYNQT
ncbi:hypothetical protein PAE9249_02226 [Paenibacillus sp. CECT 9249]|uniref:hypothetical protein n=1 Tax=Paenibacillus sp. CECT 9249 TaxID=2845385 RepID=UPI001E299F6A|nr:hypothetical protein [Paenibacillus sp. CECT 9249]CAH0119719.1 hypothetical protein PAE9249_02226 [Paenibacillus sp. CECT 9249]